MRKAKITILTTHVDRHGERCDPDSLESTAIGMNSRYLPLMVQHDLRIPPIGRIVATEVTHLPDGELALEGTVEIFEETDTLDSLAGDGRAVDIPHDDIPAFKVEYDRSYQIPEGQLLLKALKDISPESESTAVAKKALEPISTLVIAAGVFVAGAIATGFFSKLGEDLYAGLKTKLATHFQRTPTPSPRILDFRFSVSRQGDFIEVHVVIENPTPEALESLFSSNFANLDGILSEFDQSEWEIAKIVLRYRNTQLDLMYVMRKDCVPGFADLGTGRIEARLVPLFERQTTRTSKGYVSRWKQREKPEDQIVDYWFTSEPNNAVQWETKEQADIECQILNYQRIEIPSSQGGTHVCGDFRSEKFRPGSFVAFCEAPFIPQQTSGHSAKAD